MEKILQEHLSNFRDKIKDCIKNRKKILVTTHIDCDGITSGSIITNALIRAGAKCTVRTTNEFSLPLIQKLRNEKNDFHIITDLGGGFGKEIGDNLGDNWFVLDHHEISEEEHEFENVINAWKFGIDGGKEICAGGMAYLASLSLDKKNRDLSATAVISAIGDRQDQGDKRSFIGKNLEILETAKNLGLVDVDLDLLLVGRETRSLPDSLAFTSQPFIQGLTWNRDTCLSLLNSSGIQLKEGSRWRVLADLSQDEKRGILESISKYTTGKNATEIMSEFIGYTYTFPREDRHSFLRDAREFSTLLNSCGRIGKSGIGIAICMGDRNKIRDYMNILTNERWRINNEENYVIVNAEGLVPETMTGTISSLIAGSPKNSGKIVFLRTDSDEGKIKFSSRKSVGCRSDVNLSSLMKNGAAKFDGIGGGHDAAAGAKITKDKLDEFLDYIEENVSKMQSSNRSE